MTRDEFGAMAKEMSDGLAGDLHALMLKAFDALTQDEVEDLDTPDHPYFLVRAIGTVVGLRAVNDRFDVEAITRHKAKIKRILKRRYW